MPRRTTTWASPSRSQGKLDEAVACYRRALELKPDYAEAHNNLGVVFKDQGKLDEAVACCRRALELKPDSRRGRIATCSTPRFSAPATMPRRSTKNTAAGTSGTPRRWQSSSSRMRNDRSPDRRLRIGYVSPDFRDHVVGTEPPAAVSRSTTTSGSRSSVTPTCRVPMRSPTASAAMPMPGAISSGLSDEQLAQRIREDGIDILVDLTLHMARNRLLVFARKPAPVQVTFAGYPGTTGLATIDYRITDPYLDPPGLDDGCYAEESIRLPDSFWCYDPLDSEAAVNALPAAEKGYVTFGCLNNFCKVNPLVLKLWARVLKAVDRSRLMILAGEGHASPAARWTCWPRKALPRDRVTFVAHQPRPQYLELLPRHRHRTGYGSLQRAHDQPGLFLDGRAGRDPRGANGRGAGRFVPTDESRPAGTDRRQPGAICPHRGGVGPRSAPLGRSAGDPPRADAGFPADGRPAFRPEHRGRLPEMWRRWCG